MARRLIFGTRGGLLFLCWLTAAVLPLAAAEFRVDTRVFRGGEDRPLVTMTSWILETRAYDQQQGEAGRVAIFDSAARQISLLAPATQERTVISYDEVLQFIAATTTRTKDMTPLVRFASTPKFQQRWDAQARRLYLNHELMSYSAKLTKAPQDALAHQYRAFTDWAARLNTISPGLPPAARLRLNMAIAERGAVPESVRRTTPAARGFIHDMVSRHTYQWDLSDDDRAQLAVFDDWAKSFQFVDFNSFRQPGESTNGQQ